MLTTYQTRDTGVANETLSGGFGDVRFEIRHGMRTAIKTSRNTNTTMLYEADILSRLHHPFIPVVISSTKYEIVLVDFGRRCLIDTLTKDEMRRDECDKVAWCVGSALAYMHGMKFHHSDVKCDNVVVDSFGDAILIDYNLSKHSTTAVASTRCGSLTYMPPEMHKKFSTWNPFAADVWSFSVLYFAILFRCEPFDSKFSIFARFEMLQPHHGSIHSLRIIYNNSERLTRPDVHNIHERALDSMMQPNPELRLDMTSVEYTLYCIKHGLGTTHTTC